MRYLFIVQGEGRGHLTQALTLESMLRRNGHHVTEMLVGKSGARRLPRFFRDSVSCPVRHFLSPAFGTPDSTGRVSMGGSVAAALRHLRGYRRSIRFIRERIDASGADCVVNFYEVLGGLAYLFRRPAVPMVCVGHQYAFLHPDFKFPASGRWQTALLRAFTRLTAVGAECRLALSLRPMANDGRQGLYVVPPLLREAVLRQTATAGDYVHGYLLNPEFAERLEGWHRRHPETPLRFFWDKRHAPAETRRDATLSFHTLDDTLFLQGLAGCKAYACTAGFESVCEAMYLGKPVLMVPAHAEQRCNAYDAARGGAGIVAEEFDLSGLLAFSKTYRPQPAFAAWALSAESRVMAILERQQSCADIAALDARLLSEPCPQG